MALRIIAVVFITVFMIVALQATFAGPLVNIADRIADSGDYSDFAGDEDGEKIITDLPGTWFNMGIIGIFGVMLWGAIRVLRRELTRGGGL